MQVGLYLATQFTPDTAMASQTDNLLEQVRVAKASGFKSLWAAQHFITAPLQMLQPMPLLARLMSEAEGMRIGPNILVLPLLNPVIVAEEAATMDVMTGGRFTLGVGLGYREAEFDNLGVNRKTRVGRFGEAIEVMRKLWTEDEVTYQGKHFQLEDASISLKPTQAGGPPVWVAAVIDPAIRRAAAIGDAWLITFYPTVKSLTEQLVTYRAARQEAGLPPAAEYPICRECYVGADQATAFDDCRAQLEYKYRAYAAWGQDEILSEEDRFDQPFDRFKEDRFLIGDKAFIKDELIRYRETLGVDHFIMRMQWPGLDQDKVLASIERLGRIVASIN
jgi:alkanesulfonate monooxygenase SsuD/methylene tetrahydromethanopterin reductase-like flavin-dependent oxidoreductase (luciferase family)